MDIYYLFLLPVIPVLYVLGLKIKAFSTGGAIAAAVIGSLVIIGGGWLYFTMLFFFLGLSYISTLAGFERKRKRKIQEGVGGERTARNVLAAGLIPAAVSLLNLTPLNQDFVLVLYIVTLGTILADTAASEIGSLDDRTYFILTLKPAETGINGGISVLGTSVSLVFPLIFSLIGFMIYGITINISFARLIELVVASGLISFSGCLFDSVLGETLENRGYLDKYSVNFFASLFSAVVVALIFLSTNYFI